MGAAASFRCSSSPTHPAAIAKTTSTCTTETAQGSHLFRISGYSRTKGLGVGKWITSGTFSVGGYDWAILYYPDGSKQECEGYISVSVKLISEDTMVRAGFELKLVDQTTGLSCSVRTLETPRVFKNPDKPVWGFPKFKAKSKLEASPYVAGDCLTIECVLTVVNGPQVSNTKTLSKMEVPPSDIANHLGILLEEKEGVDVTFNIDGETFAAHKLVLAMRSPVFEAELYGPMKEKDTPCIIIKDMQPTVFKTFLHFIYTDSLPFMDGLERDDNKEMVRHLLVAADRYAMERLKLLCENILSKSLDVETVATTLALADQHQCHRLKDICIEFIVSSHRKEDVVASQGYEHLKKNCPSIIVEIFERMTRIHKL